VPLKSYKRGKGGNPDVFSRGEGMEREHKKVS